MPSFNTQTMKNWIITALLFFFGMCAAHAGGTRALLIGISEYPTHRMPELTWNPIHGANIEWCSVYIFRFMVSILVTELLIAYNI